MTEEKKELFDAIPSPYSPAQMQWIARELNRVQHNCKSTPEFLAEALFAISKLAALSASTVARGTERGRGRGSQGARGRAIAR